MMRSQCERIATSHQTPYSILQSPINQSDGGKAYRSLFGVVLLTFSFFARLGSCVCGTESGTIRCMINYFNAKTPATSATCNALAYKRSAVFFLVVATFGFGLAHADSRAGIDRQASSVLNQFSISAIH